MIINCRRFVDSYFRVCFFEAATTPAKSFALGDAQEVFRMGIHSDPRPAEDDARAFPVVVLAAQRLARELAQRGLYLRPRRAGAPCDLCPQRTLH
jgi:hypothetical protein